MDHRAKNCKPQTLFKKKFLGKQKTIAKTKTRTIEESLVTITIARTQSKQNQTPSHKTNPHTKGLLSQFFSPNT